MDAKIYRCKQCGNMVVMIKDSGMPLSCCGEEMELLIANTVDAAVEKHVPVCCKEGCTVHVNVGEEDHPMGDKHSIEWVCLLTDQGSQCRWLRPGCAPKVCFKLCKHEKPLAVYAYCNIHGLWKCECKEK